MLCMQTCAPLVSGRDPDDELRPTVTHIQLPAPVSGVGARVCVCLYVSPAPVLASGMVVCACTSCTRTRVHPHTYTHLPRQRRGPITLWYCSKMALCSALGAMNTARCVVCMCTCHLGSSTKCACACGCVWVRGGVRSCVSGGALVRNCGRNSCTRDLN